MPESLPQLWRVPPPRTGTGAFALFWASRHECGSFWGCDRAAFASAGPACGAIKMAARRRRSAWVIAALGALLGGWEERVQIAARPVQPKTVALQGETN